MSVAVDDVRHFETAIELSPEDQRSNLEYFREQGLEADYETPIPADAPPAAKPPLVESPGPELNPADTPVEDEPTEEREAGDEDPADTDPDDETVTNDGEKPKKPGWRAKRTAQIRDLEATIAQEKGANEELRRQLATRERPPVADASTSLAPAPVVEVPKVAAAAEAAKPVEFAKARPTRPKFEDFVSADDPIAVFADAGLAYTEALQEWKDEKKEWDSGQKQIVQDQTRVQEGARQAAVERERKAQERVAAIEVVHPDFDEVTRGKFTPVLAYVLRIAARDGLEIGYQLGKPENADLLAALRKTSAHKESDSQSVIEDKIAEATFDVAAIAVSLKERERASKKAPPAAPKAQAPAQPAAVQTPPASAAPPKEARPAQPRREEAAPVPTRSRGAAGQRLEDIPLNDYDARRKWREANGGV